MGILWYGKRLIMKKEFPILYKYTQTGAIQQWQIIVEHDRFYTIEGHKDGKLSTSLPTICIGKNIGKKNQTSPMDQALAEATAKHQKKLDKSYNEVLTDKKNFFEPMLAETVEDYEKFLFTVDTWIQPKLDGLRAVNQENSLKSRNGKVYVTCPHLYQDKAILDGELYNHDFYDDFNEIVSIIKQDAPTQEDFDKAKKFGQFWCYDFPSHKGIFSERYKALKEFLKELNNDSIILVPTYKVESWDDIKSYHKQFTTEGYEGSIIRLDLKEYENKRTKQLLKFKDWMDAEFQIISAEEGKGGRLGTVAAFWVVLDPTQPYFISTNAKKRVNCCKTNVKGSHEYLKKVWDNIDNYIGKQATIEFQGWTPGKKALRFPYAIKLDRQSYE